MNYGELKTLFDGILKRRDITAAERDSFIQIGIARVQSELRVPALETAEQVTIGATYTGISIPSNYLGLKELYFEGYPDPLVRRPLGEVKLGERCTGVPRIFAREGGSFRVAPAPVSGDKFRVNYYRDMAPLVEASDTNIISIISPQLIVYAALASVTGDRFTDKRTPAWEARYQQILDSLHNQAALDELSGGASVAPAFTYDE